MLQPPKRADERSFYLEYAQEHDFVIVTYDEDFYEWQQLRRYPSHIVWLRFGNAPTKYISQKLISQRDKILKMADNEDIGILEIQ